MISDVILKYNKAKFEIINKFSNNDINICEESLCIDKGYLKSKFEDFQKEHKLIINEIDNLYTYGNKDEYNNSKIESLIKTKNVLCLNISYLISNDMDNLHLSKKLIKDINSNLHLAIDGMINYFSGNNVISYNYMQDYYSSIDIIPQHYLINKIYSLLLVERNEYGLAIEVMRRALSVNPSDIELHKKLRGLYEIEKNKIGYKVESQIIHILEG